MLQHHVAAGIDDKCDLRTKRCDVSEILLRPDTQIDDARGHELCEFRKNDLVRQLVGRNNLKRVASSRLRKISDQLPESSITELRRECIRGTAGNTRNKKI